MAHVLDRRRRAISLACVTALALLIAPLAPLAVFSTAQTPDVTATIVEAWPGAAVTLRAREGLYLRVSYDSPRPVRIQAEAWRAGQKVPAAMTNPSPVYPAGGGEAIAWLAFGDGGEVDEFRAVVFDERWAPLSHAALRRTVQWSAGAAPAGPRPAWVNELSSRQQQATSEALARSSDGPASFLMGVLTVLAFASVPAYPLVQAFALWWLTGWRRRLAFIPVLVMAPTYVVCLIALVGQSNLWPIWAIFLSPPSVLFLCAVMMTGLAGRRSLPAGNPANM